MSSIPENIPPIIRGWIEQMNNSSNKEHVRDNYYVILDNVSKFISTELRRYDNNKSKNVNLKIKTKK